MARRRRHTANRQATKLSKQRLQRNRANRVLNLDNYLLYPSSPRTGLAARAINRRRIHRIRPLAKTPLTRQPLRKTKSLSLYDQFNDGMRPERLRDKTRCRHNKDARRKMFFASKMSGGKVRRQPRRTHKCT